VKLDSGTLKKTAV